MSLSYPLVFLLFLLTMSFFLFKSSSLSCVLIFIQAYPYIPLLLKLLPQGTYLGSNFLSFLAPLPNGGPFNILSRSQHPCMFMMPGCSWLSSILLKYPFPAFQPFQTLTRNHSLMTPEKNIYPFNIQWHHDSDGAVYVYDIKYLNIHSRLLLTSPVVWAALLSLCTVSERVKSLSMCLGVTNSFV